MLTGLLARLCHLPSNQMYIGVHYPSGLDHKWLMELEGNSFSHSASTAWAIPCDRHGVKQCYSTGAQERKTPVHEAQSRREITQTKPIPDKGTTVEEARSTLTREWEILSGKDMLRKTLSWKQKVKELRFQIGGGAGFAGGNRGSAGPRSSEREVRGKEVLRRKETAWT